MRIGIEAKWLFRGPPSGRRVVWNLSRALAGTAADGGDELTFFLDDRNRGETLPLEIDHEHVQYVWGGNNQLANLFAVPRAADRLRLDAVVYQNFVPSSGFARHSRIAFIHDVIFESHPHLFTLRERMYFAPMRCLARTADRVCTVSGSERERLIRLGYADAARVDVIPNAVDATFVPLDQLPADRVSLVSNRFGLPARFVLYAGRLNARKNISALAHAMAQVDDDVMLVVAGARDATSENLDALASQLGIRHRVRLLGAVTDDELRVLYAKANVFCFPSLDEGFGLGPLEAMACGTPVVASAIPAIEETCAGAAVLVNPLDPDDIAIALLRVLGDPSLCADMRSRGRIRVSEFSWRRSAERLLASVHTAAQRRQATAA